MRERVAAGPNFQAAAAAARPTTAFFLFPPTPSHSNSEELHARFHHHHLQTNPDPSIGPTGDLLSCCSCGPRESIHISYLHIYVFVENNYTHAYIYM